MLVFCFFFSNEGIYVEYDGSSITLHFFHSGVNLQWIDTIHHVGNCCHMEKWKIPANLVLSTVSSFPISLPLFSFWKSSVAMVIHISNLNCCTFYV